jgi:hypothetical protein
MSALLRAFDAKYNPPVPPYSKILETYEQEDPQKNLRLGQWFFNRYLRRMSNSPEIDTLYNSTDFSVIFSIIEKFYHDYQWPM